MDRSRSRRRGRGPPPRQRNPRQGATAGRCSVLHSPAGDRGRRDPVVSALRFCRHRARRLHVRWTIRPGGVRTPGDHVPVRRVVVPASGIRSRQRPHRDRPRCASRHDQRALPHLRRPAATRRWATWARDRGRSARVGSRRSAGRTDHPDLCDRGRHPAAGALSVHHHQNAAESNRPSPARALRLSVRGTASGCPRIRDRGGSDLVESVGRFR